MSEEKNHFCFGMDDHFQPINSFIKNVSPQMLELQPELGFFNNKLTGVVDDIGLVFDKYVSNGKLVSFVYDFGGQKRFILYTYSMLAENLKRLTLVRDMSNPINSDDSIDFILNLTVKEKIYENGSKTLAPVYFNPVTNTYEEIKMQEQDSLINFEINSRVVEQAKRNPRQSLPIISEKIIKPFNSERFPSIGLVLTKSDTVNAALIDDYKNKILNDDIVFGETETEPDGRTIDFLINTSILDGDTLRDKVVSQYRKKGFDADIDRPINSGADYFNNKSTINVKAAILNSILKVVDIDTGIPYQLAEVGLAGVGNGGKSSLIKKFHGLHGMLYKGMTVEEVDNPEEYGTRLTVGKDEHKFYLYPDHFMYHDSNNLMHYVDDNLNARASFTVNQYNPNNGRVLSFWQRTYDENGVPSEWINSDNKVNPETGLDKYSLFHQTNLFRYKPALDYKLCLALAESRVIN